MSTTERKETHKTLRSAIFILFAFLFGTVTGLIGVGPGLIAAVLMSYMFGLTVSNARSLVTVLILSAAVPALIVYGFNGDLHLRAALEVAIGTFIGALASASIFRRRLIMGVRKFAAFLLIAVAVEMVLSAHHLPAVAEPFQITFGIALALGFVAGFIGSISALAAAKILVPLIVLLTVVPQKSAQALALAASIPAAIPLALTNYAVGGVDRAGVIEYSAAAALGGLLGAGIAVELSEPVLTLAFAAFLLVTCTYVVFRNRV